MKHKQTHTQKASKDIKPSAQYNPIISLNHGQHAYIRMPDGKTLHLATDSEEFRPALAILATHHGNDKVNVWLDSLSWGKFANK